MLRRMIENIVLRLNIHRYKIMPYINPSNIISDENSSERIYSLESFFTIPYSVLPVLTVLRPYDTAA